MYEYLDDPEQDYYLQTEGTDEDEGPLPDDEAVLLLVAAQAATERGVPQWCPEVEPDGAGESPLWPGDRVAALRRATRRWIGRAADIDDFVELMRDAVDARDRCPRLWQAATEEGVVYGGELRQIVHALRARSWADCLAEDASLSTFAHNHTNLWHTVYWACDVARRLRSTGLTDEEIATQLADWARRQSGLPLAS